jgi:hypothetical protein
VKIRPIVRFVVGLCLFAIGVGWLIYLFAFAEEVQENSFILAGVATLIGIGVALSDPPPKVPKKQKVQKEQRKTDWEDIGGKAMRTLGWLWLIAVNIFYVLVILYVFDNLSGRTEHILVSILGLLYVAVRGHALALAMTLPGTFLAIHREFARIRKLLSDKSGPTPTNQLDDDEYLDVDELVSETSVPSSKELDDAATKIERQYWKLAAHSFFLSIVALICLFQLFTSLSK